MGLETVFNGQVGSTSRLFCQVGLRVMFGDWAESLAGISLGKVAGYTQQSEKAPGWTPLLRGVIV